MIVLRNLISEEEGCIAVFDRLVRKEARNDEVFKVSLFFEIRAYGRVKKVKCYD